MSHDSSAFMWPPGSTPGPLAWHHVASALVSSPLPSLSLTGTLHLSVHREPNKHCVLLGLSLVVLAKVTILQCGTVFVLLPSPGPWFHPLCSSLWSICSSHSPSLCPLKMDARNWLILSMALSCHRALHILST